MIAPEAKILAVITGERGMREIVRPLAKMGHQLHLLDWEELRQRPGSSHRIFLEELWSRLRQQKFTHVFTDMSSGFLVAVLVFGKMRGVKVLMRLRGDLFAESRDQIVFHLRHLQPLLLLRSLIGYLLDSLVFRFVDRYVPVSHWIVRRLGIKEKSVLVRIPCDPAAFVQRTHECEGLRLLAVTNFNYPQKVAPMGFFFDRYQSFLKGHGIEVTVAGSGIALESFQKRYGHEVNFLGHVPITGLYAQFDAFIHFSGLDAFPYVVLEAQAAGLPVLVNNACGMLEQVEDGVTGLIVDLDVTSEVQQKILDLKNSPAFRAQLGAAGLKAVAERYSLAKVGEDLQKAL